MKPLASQALELIGKDWSVGKLTREAHLQHTKDFADFVRQKFAMEKIQNLKPNHVLAYVQNMKDQGLDNGTMCNRMAAVRDLAEAIGKGNIVARKTGIMALHEAIAKSRSSPTRRKLTGSGRP